jgi:hypothetical protein
MRATLLTACLIAAPSAEPALILSEAFADPSAWGDAQGEFIELGNPGPDSAAWDSVAVTVEGQSLRLGSLGLGPRECFLICRDSLAASASGWACRRGWPGMTLANGRSLSAEIAWRGGSFRASLPPSRTGVSWENTWDASAGFAAFLPSRAALAGGDSATPGARNSRSALAPARDLALGGAEWDPGQGILRVTVEDRGSAPAERAGLALRLDADWDGSAETLIDSAPLPAGAYPRTVSIAVPPAARGLADIRLTRDEDPADDGMRLNLGPKGPLALAEWHPAPKDGAPEWVEIRNRTGDGGGEGRRVSLALAALNGCALGARAGGLDPGERLVLTADTAAFRARYGRIAVRALRPEGWKALRNAGDTLVLSLAGFASDSIAYGPVPPDEGGTPGYAGPDSAPAGWRLWGRKASPGGPLDIEVRVAPGGSFVLRAFDPEGGLVREIARGGPGRHRLAWDGKAERGRALPRGPYILCLSFGDGTSRKRAVLAGER